MMKRSIITSFLMALAMMVVSNVDAMRRGNVPSKASSKPKPSCLWRLVPGKKCMMLAAVTVAAALIDSSYNCGAGMTWALSFFPTSEVALAWLSENCPEVVTNQAGSLALVARENMPGWLITAGNQLVSWKSWVAGMVISSCNITRQGYQHMPTGSTLVNNYALSDDGVVAKAVVTGEEPNLFVVSEGTMFICNPTQCAVLVPVETEDCYEGQEWTNPGNGSKGCLWPSRNRQP